MEIIKVALICLTEKRLLVVHKKTIDMYISPGGKIERGESDLKCLEREIQEELGCGVFNINYLHTFKGKSVDEEDEVELRCYTGDLIGDIKLNPKDNIDGFLWIDKNYDKNIKLASLLKYQIIPYLVSRRQM